jgi:hypothetical protein
MHPATTRFQAGTQEPICPEHSDPLAGEIANQKIVTIIEMVTAQVIQQYLGSLVAIGSRMTGTPGCAEAAEYIYQEFLSMGLESTSYAWRDYGGFLLKRTYEGQNIEGVLRGEDASRDVTIVFNAHYDTVEGTPGADDDGSGTAAVLAAAHVLSQFDFRNTIKFVAFSGEEIGLLGSGAYAKEAYDNEWDILVELNADMIGHTATKEGGRKLRTYITEDAVWVLDAVEHVNKLYDFRFEIINGTFTGGRGGSDYYSFLIYGFEAAAFFEGEWNPNMHTPDDTLENVNISYLVNTTRIIVSTIAYLADMEQFPPQTKIVSPRRGAVYINGEAQRALKHEDTVVIGDIVVRGEERFGSGNAVTRAEFYYDDQLEYVDTDPPFEWHLDKISLGSHTLKLVMYDTGGESGSDVLPLVYINLRR